MTGASASRRPADAPSTIAGWLRTHRRLRSDDLSQRLRRADWEPQFTDRLDEASEANRIVEPVNGNEAGLDCVRGSTY